MNKLLLIAIAAILLAPLAAVPAPASDWSVREQETTQKTFPLSGEPMRLIVDNVEGYVHVRGVDGSEVRVTAHKTVRAESASDLQQARSEVHLEQTAKPGAVSIYYDAPWRCGEHRTDRDCHDHDRRFYEVVFDIDIEAPRNAHLVVSTVNAGDIRIENNSANFDVKDVNVGIEMSGISGSGDVHTINGPVTVRFSKNPTGPTSFKSINGHLNAYFQPGLSADLLFKTFNGQVYSDFDVQPRAIPVSGQTERRDGKYVYHSNGFRAGRAGAGGPELSFDTLNGNINLHNAANANEPPRN